MTQSVSIQASLIDSVLDGITSFINFVALRYSQKPADCNHRWGHGKAEALAGFAQSIFIIIFSVYLVWEAVWKIITPETISQTGTGIILMIFASIVTLFLIFWQNYVIRKTGSLIIKADCLHYETDLFTNIGVITSLYLTSRFNFQYIDAIIALLIAAYLITSSWSILWRSVDVLMDKELDPEITNTIGTMVLSHKKISGIQELRTKETGNNKQYIQFAIQVDPKTPLKEAQNIIQDLKATLHKAYPHIETTIYPVSK